MILAWAVALALSSPSGLSASAAIPEEITALAENVRGEKDRAKRAALLSDLISEVKRRIAALPENIDESELPRVQVLYELDVLLGPLSPEKITPASCPPILRNLEEMSGPRDPDGKGGTETGRLAIGVVKSLCEP